ncbi:MAG: hypothetical protein U0529_13960 [Thermoanaerobaculia bacterium]
MRQIASLALAFALFAAPAALAADCPGHANKDKAACCAKKEGATAADRKCDPATCKDAKKCTADEKAKCAESCAKKAEAPKPPKS